MNIQTEKEVYYALRLIGRFRSQNVFYYPRTSRKISQLYSKRWARINPKRMAMQGQSLEKKTELLIILGEPYLFNVQIILYFKDQNSLYSKT